MFLLIANRKESEIVATEKGDKHKPGKLPLSYLPGVCDYLFFTGRRLIHRSVTAAPSISE